jgi:hypothetical protein
LVKAGINLKLLKPGTIILVETQRSVYKIKVLIEGKISIVGGMTADGQDRYPVPVEGVFIGSSEGVILERDWIGQGLRMEIIVLGHDKLITSPVQRAEIEAADGNWRYCMDWD